MYEKLRSFYSLPCELAKRRFAPFTHSIVIEGKHRIPNFKSITIQNTDNYKLKVPLAYTRAPISQIAGIKSIVSQTRATMFLSGSEHACE